MPEQQNVSSLELLFAQESGQNLSLAGDFLAEVCLDELFLTLAPQFAGRDESVERFGLVAGKLFAPDQPRWGRLIAVRRGENHLFLRYALKTV